VLPIQPFQLIVTTSENGNIRHRQAYLATGVLGFDRNRTQRKEVTMLNGTIKTILIASLAFATFGVYAADSETAPGFWSTPAIQGFGKMHELPKSAYRPEAHKTYKIVFAVTKGVKGAAEVNPSLDRVARTVNLYVASGVPVSQLKFVAIVYGEATPLVLDDAHYREKFGEPNPNLSLIALLRKAGVDVAVCGQAVAEHHIDYAWVDQSVTTALSGLTTVTTLEQSGYALMPL
jgi:intracellular sulfur oxidation DsrE/DsrF family protein